MSFYLILLFFSCFLINYFLIYIFNTLKIFQPQREITKNRDLVATFGGISFIFGLFLHVFCSFFNVFCSFFNVFDTFFIIFFSFLIGFLGFLDDYDKIITRNDNGLSAKMKFVLEFFIAFGYLYFDGYLISWLGIWGSLIWGSFVIVSCINAVNITDGVDGLAASISFWPLGFLYFYTFDRLALEMIVILLAFLCFNLPNAKLYMGDVGALSLGAVLGASFLKHHIELLFPFLGIVFVLTVLSSVVQMIAISFFNKKVFSIAPYHHHLSEKGFSKWQILCLFHAISAVGCFFAVLIMKYKFLIGF